MTSGVAAGTAMVRALFRAVEVPGRAPHNVLTTKVYYPAVYGATPTEINTGNLPAAKTGAPFPVAIVMPGINVSPESYGWLATELAQAGFVAVIYGWIAEEIPGVVTLSPGMDGGALMPAAIGTRPSASALPALLQDLAEQNRTGPLAGLLDLDRILLGGHSGGGTITLFNARPDWFAGLRAVFTYAAHAKLAMSLGYAAGTVQKLDDRLPKLILGGSEDGVIAASAFRYGEPADAKPDPVKPLLRTFEEGLSSRRGDCYLGILRGANHFSMAWPPDPATGRPFLDWPLQRDANEIRRDLGKLVTLFARAHVAGDGAARQALANALKDTTRVQHSAVR